MRVPKLIGQLVAGRFGMFYTNEQRGASNQKARQQLGWQPQYASWRDGFPQEINKALEPSLD
jgi:2-alkyl-3-oxoalkanoate reductase